MALTLLSQSGMKDLTLSLFRLIFIFVLSLQGLQADARFNLKQTYEESLAKTDRVVMRKKILMTLKKYLPKKYNKDSYAISRTIMSESRKYNLDPLVVTAVIAGESSFNPRAVGSVGEIGLMQLRPETAQWLAKYKRFRWRGAHSLYNPVTNIRYGTAYLAYLKEFFHERGVQGEHLYLAAYNMGAGSVLKNLAKNIRPEIYKKHVMKRYLSLND